MSKRKRFTAEQIIPMLREAEVELACALPRLVSAGNSILPKRLIIAGERNTVASELIRRNAFRCLRKRTPN